jgi:Ran GTPase-activating protein (RanGAP) involved in mRNA processing and transport
MNVLIKTLDISRYGDKGFTTILFKKVIEGLKILQSVESLNLSHNKIDDKFMDLIIDLFHVKNLRRLDLSYNLISTKGARKLIHILKVTEQLEYLDVSYNPFSKDETICSEFVLSLKSHQKLYHFGISDHSHDNLAIKLIHTKGLRSLNLEDSRLHVKSYEALLRYLNKDKCNLAILSLKFNTIDVLYAGYIEKILNKNNSLVFINLYSTGLSDLAGEKIISALEFNKTLIEIDLGANKLSTNFSNRFNKVLKLNKILKKINLSKNYLIDNDNFEIILEGLVNNSSVISLGDLNDTKVNAKLRESAEKILNLNKKYSNVLFEKENNVGVNVSSSVLEVNKSQKLNLLRSSLNKDPDYIQSEKIKRESLDNLKEEFNGNEELIAKYDLKFYNDNYEFLNFNINQI